MDTAPLSTTETTKLRWCQPTPGRLVGVLLLVELILLISERFRWFPFNEHKGWTVLIAIASVGVTIVLALLWIATALCFRWRFQFSLRLLLVLTVAAAVPFSWLAVEMQARGRDDAVEAIQKLGGGVGYDLQTDLTPPGLSWLRALLGDEFFANVTTVSLHNMQEKDAGLEHLKRLPQLRTLYLDDTKITDAGLVHLKGLTQLQWLDLGNTNVSNVGLDSLEGLTQLQWLNLDNTLITDAGLVHLKGMTQLQFLMLGKTQVTDKGLEQLKGLDGLRTLFLIETAVTDKGVKDLQQALPKCLILHSDLPSPTKRSSPFRLLRIDFQHFRERLGTADRTATRFCLAGDRRMLTP
jgi:hypothetical protein